MSLILVMVLLIAIAVLAPRFGVDSRGLTDRVGRSPDVMPGPRDTSTEPARRGEAAAPAADSQRA